MLLLWSSNAVFVAAVACKLVRTYAQAPLASGARMVSPWMTEKRGQLSLFIDEKVKKNVETGNESMPTCCLVATCGACCCSALLLHSNLKLFAQIANTFPRRTGPQPTDEAQHRAEKALALTDRAHRDNLPFWSSVAFLISGSIKYHVLQGQIQ
jgi:hypothetical protein